MTINTTAAAKVLAVTPRRVIALIAAGRIPAERDGKMWVIDKRRLDDVKNRKPGRPKTVYRDDCWRKASALLRAF